MIQIMGVHKRSFLSPLGDFLFLLLSVFTDLSVSHHYPIPEHFHYPENNLHTHAPLPAGAGSHWSASYPCRFADHTHLESEHVWTFVSTFFHLALLFSVCPCYNVSELHFPLWLRLFCCVAVTCLSSCHLIDLTCFHFLVIMLMLLFTLCIYFVV